MSPADDGSSRQAEVVKRLGEDVDRLRESISQLPARVREGAEAGRAAGRDGCRLLPRYTDKGYPENPDPLAPAKGIRNGLILAGGFWLVCFLLLLIAVR